MSTCPVPHIQALLGMVLQTVLAILSWLILKKISNKSEIHWCNYLLMWHLKLLMCKRVLNILVEADNLT